MGPSTCRFGQDTLAVMRAWVARVFPSTHLAQCVKAVGDLARDSYSPRSVASATLINGAPRRRQEQAAAERVPAKLPDLPSMESLRAPSVGVCTACGSALRVFADIELVWGWASSRNGRRSPRRIASPTRLWKNEASAWPGTWRSGSPQRSVVVWPTPLPPLCSG